MGKWQISYVAFIVSLLVISRAHPAMAYEINPQTSIASAASSSQSFGTAFGSLQFIPNSISGVLSQFQALEAFLVQHAGFLGVLNPTEFYMRLNNGAKSHMGISLTDILGAVGGALIWIINTSVAVLNFVSNLIAGGLAHL